MKKLRDRRSALIRETLLYGIAAVVFAGLAAALWFLQRTVGIAAVAIVCAFAAVAIGNFAVGLRIYRSFKKLSRNTAVSFAFINANDSSTISGLDELMGGENFLLSLNGELFDGEWDYYMEGNSFEIRMQVPEPATYAAIFGALALAFAVCRRRK